LGFFRTKYRLPRAISAVAVLICIMIITSIVVGSFFAK
jgi:hypothetical protein